MSGVVIERLRTLAPTFWQAWAGQENFEPLAEGNAGTDHPNGTTAD
jgi:hypothetical protein